MLLLQDVARHGGLKPLESPVELAQQLVGRLILCGAVTSDCAMVGGLPRLEAAVGAWGGGSSSAGLSLATVPPLAPSHS